MESRKMVRCCIGKKSAGTIESVRYIPLEEFGLWQYLMEHKHGFNITDMKVSVWVDVAEFDRLRHVYSHMDREEVNKMTLFAYSLKDGIHYQIVRFLPRENYDTIKDIIIKHFSNSDDSTGKRYGNMILDELRGFWLKP
jgi:hypothetical protein